MILPRNTEYEIFSIGERPHTLGAVFVLNHRSMLRLLAPPVARIADLARDEGALLDLDKHSWPWSLMLVPVETVDLFERSNNSVWRTRFGFNSAPAGLPAWLQVQEDGPNTLTEWGWMNYGFEVYYALLNCGFRLSPTAGTASGVHPVLLGYSRVYVHTGVEFDLGAWLRGLKAGRSFVTTGPMLFATVNRRLSGERFEFAAAPDAVLHDADALKGAPVQEFFHRRMAQAALEIERTRIERGAVIWKLYDHAFVVRTRTVIFAFDLTRAYLAGGAGFALAARLVSPCDALFISHRHGDHADSPTASPASGARRFMVVGA